MFPLRDRYIANLLCFAHFLNYHIFSEKFIINYSNFPGVGCGGEGSFILSVLFAETLGNLD